ncbi:MAG: ribonuclease III [Candidatus Taylorbacteria bacterium RIFCSPHIGHO2_02_FULL_44_36]|uniref:Ribonuclease 3 n=1 Tax=Candidatus Taylorbacteria bacterium RIFCSPLOWO2_12_FULL_44_15c TaxID=1802333 RepID=A0A1G2P3Q3_9BACT|nr:MAG: ribonuclease III [Candidatus Taylorbacteria bacterium RIFCSPHIGHO2_02_FULL_44_36]OHA39641.1 MAG: ribonuclease III [Candidatus Taylorbacteria bacterium RIFCSPLOWO2_02_FULL_44_35]OHA42966.1 MAG: ribonuclease III [Candidatus Taylorbacteria bacterium RIFCSPLOWO2_12_FULL_44_15c]
MNFSEFEKNINVVFEDKALLQQAFTHRSYLNENRKTNLEHNERLEFLGDAVLELIVTVHLYEKYPTYNEGEMTSLRSVLVNANTMAELANKIRMNDFMLLSRGEAKDTGRARQYILANAVEALIGAIFLDQGYKVAEKFVGEQLFLLLPKIIKEGFWLDAKSHFQEKAQEIAGVTPSYETLKETGPDHDKHFTIGVFLGKEKVAEGDGKSKQDAEQAAARAGLQAKNWN